MTKQKLLKICARAIALLGMLALLAIPPAFAYPGEPWYTGYRWCDNNGNKAEVTYSLAWDIHEYVYQNDLLTHEFTAAIAAWQAIDGYPSGPYLSLSCHPSGCVHEYGDCPADICIEFKYRPGFAPAWVEGPPPVGGCFNKAYLNLNSYYSWDSEGHYIPGGEADLYELLLHELGHALVGLDDYQYGIGQYQIMSGGWANKYVVLGATQGDGCYWNNGVGPHRQILFTQDIFNVRCVYQYSQDPNSPYYGCLNDVWWGHQIVPPQRGICGDVNGDGAINMGDVSLLHTHVGYPSRYISICNWCADVTGNCIIDMGDVSLLHSYVGHPGQYTLNCFQ